MNDSRKGLTPRRIAIAGVSVVAALVLLALIDGPTHVVTMDKPLGVSAEVAWRPWTRLDAIADFHPDLASSRLVGEQARGVGARREVTTTAGMQITHRIVAWDDPGRSHAFEFYSDELPLKHAVCRISVEARGPATSVVHFRVEMEPKFGLLGWAIGKLVLESKLKQGATHLLDGLEDHVTGVPEPG